MKSIPTKSVIVLAFLLLFAGGCNQNNTIKISCEIEQKYETLKDSAYLNIYVLAKADVAKTTTATKAKLSSILSKDDTYRVLGVDGVISHGRVAIAFIVPPSRSELKSDEEITVVAYVVSGNNSSPAFSGIIEPDKADALYRYLDSNPDIVGIAINKFQIGGKR